MTPLRAEISDEIGVAYFYVLCRISTAQSMILPKIEIDKSEYVRYCVRIIEITKGGITMTNTNVTNFRQNAFAYFDQAVMFGDVINVNTKHGNAIIMSEEDYRAMVETLYLTSLPGMTESILASREEKTEDCQPFDPSEDW